MEKSLGVGYGNDIIFDYCPAVFVLSARLALRLGNNIYTYHYL